MMQFLLIFVMVSFCGIATLKGTFEGYLWDLNSFTVRPIQKDLHPSFALERIGFSLLALMVVITNYHWLVSVLMAVSFVLSYPYFHNGAMYKKRHELNAFVYRDGWYSNPSETSKARVNITYKLRLVMFIVGSVIFTGAVVLSIILS